MHTIVKVADLTEEQRNAVTIQCDRTWEDVEYIDFQMRKNGEIDHAKAHYKERKITRQYDVIDQCQLLYGNKHSKDYQNAKKRCGFNNKQIEEARRAMDYLSHEEA